MIYIDRFFIKDVLKWRIFKKSKPIRLSRNYYENADFRKDYNQHKNYHSYCNTFHPFLNNSYGYGS